MWRPLPVEVTRQLSFVSTSSNKVAEHHGQLGLVQDWKMDTPFTNINQAVFAIVQLIMHFYVHQCGLNQPSYP